MNAETFFNNGFGEDCEKVHKNHVIQLMQNFAEHYHTEQLRLYRVSGRFSSNDVDLSYCCGVFNVVGIDGLSDELKRLKEINKKPHEIFNFISNDR